MGRPWRDVVLDPLTLPDSKLGVADPGFQSALKLGASGKVWVKISCVYRKLCPG